MLDPSRTVVIEISDGLTKVVDEHGSSSLERNIKLTLSIPSKPYVRRDELTERKVCMLRDYERSGLPMSCWCSEAVEFLGPRETWSEEFR